MKLFKLLIAVAFALLPSCGGGDGGGGGPSGVDGSKQVLTITEAEKGTLCDWYVDQVGGYGAVDPCPEFGLSAPPNKADCVAGFPFCNVSVGQLEACINTILSAEKTCTTEAITAAQMDQNCQTAGAAGCFD